ncbi:DUF4333 domain-containing protein [Mycolicibacterium sp.]|uniref:DUF4333 domain-containing protein n=1 Tax=Mycolicibacterium sp. TaxID=2320850 RepID=UPI003D0FE81F
MRISSAVVTGVTAALTVVGCTAPAPDGLPTVAAADLQADVAARLAAAGEQPQSVTCTTDLVGEVGQVARCDVVLSPTNSFAPIITVTDVDGATIGYEMTPALSPAQLERAVTRLLSDSGSVQPDSVTCQSDLVGRIGEVAYCEVSTAGVTLRRTAAVTSVEGLMMNFDLVPVLTKAEVETSLLDELASHLAQRPDSAVCTGDLEGRPGNTVDCTVVVGPDSATFRLTVTEVDGDKIDYSYAPL